MKRLFTLLLVAMLLSAALPTLADTDGYPDNILLENGIPYGNYGYPGLVKLHSGDMDKVVAHMRSARANQQGAGISYQRGTTATASGPSLSSWQLIIRDELEDDPNLYWGEYPEGEMDPPHVYFGKEFGTPGYFSTGEYLQYMDDEGDYGYIWPRDL